jgi:hypothetical protein
MYTHDALACACKLYEQQVVGDQGAGCLQCSSFVAASKAAFACKVLLDGGEWLVCVTMMQGVSWQHIC